MPAIGPAIAMVRELAELQQPRPASEQLAGLEAFLARHLSPLDPAHELFDRERRARAAIQQILQQLASAHASHHDPAWSVADLATSVRRWIGDQTFAPEGASSGVQLLDDQAARYGDFDDMTIVGLIESEWPDRPRRNIFYPPSLLKALGWPSEKDRRARGGRAVPRSARVASARVELSTFMLDDEALVTRSIQLDEVPRARLSTMSRPLDRRTASSRRGAGQREGALEHPGEETRAWLELRRERTPADDMAFHGAAGPRPPRTWSVSALETYLGCPFKFFAQHVLRLEEEPDDEEVMDPRRQGQFVHEVFETVLRRTGRRPATARSRRRISRARARCSPTSSIARSSGCPKARPALERTRLLGSPAAAGLGEAVFRMEAERPVPVVERLLEHKLDGPFTIADRVGSAHVHAARQGRPRRSARATARSA